MGYYRKVDTATNLLPYSQEFDNGAWSKQRSTVDPDVAVAPDGTTTADKIDNNGSEAGTTGINHSLTKAAAIRTYTLSLYVKKADKDWCLLSIGDVNESDWSRSRFNVATGALGTLSDKGVVFVGLDSGIEDAGNGWYRCWLTASTDDTTTVTAMLRIADADGDHSLAAGTGQALYFWGAQLEVGSKPTPYIPTTTVAVTAAVRRDNHWHKDHNGIWRRSLKLEGPRNGFTEWTNLVDYSAGPFKDNSFWDDPTADYTSMENVVSCIEGGTALRAVSAADRGVRIHSYGNFGTNSGGVEVMSGIFERVNQVYSAIASWDGSWTNYIQANYDWGSKQLDLQDAQGLHVDRGFENLGVGPNGGELVRIWIAFDTGHVDWSGNARNIQWRVDNNFSGVETGILHHAQYYEIPSGYSNSDNGAPTGPIVNLDATNNNINRESFNIPISFNPQVMSVYVRLKQGWSDGQHTVFSVGGTFGCRLYVQNNNTTGGTFFGRFTDGTGVSTCQMQQATNFAFGDTAELVLALSSDGSVKGWSSKNGAAWETSTAGATDPTIPGAWGTNAVYLNATNSSKDGSGFIEIEAFKIVGTAITDAAGAEWLRGYKETGTREY